MIAEFESRTVDSVSGTEHGGQNETYHKGRLSAILQIGGEDVGRVWPEAWAEKLAQRRAGEFAHEFGQFPFRVSPWKVVVGLAETEFCEPIHHFWAGESFGKK